MYKGFYTFVFIFVILFNFTSSAQVTKDSIRSRYFRQRDFAKYFISDSYAPTPQVQAGMGTNKPEYNIAPERTTYYLPYNQTDFGAEIPFFTRVKYSDSKLKFKFSISTPIAARIWFDFTEPSTRPVLNTDYQYAPLEFNYLRAVYNSIIHNYVIKLLPFFHESSHLGDEITLYKRQDTVPVNWVNVSYETAELAVTLNDVNGKLTNNSAFKIGLKVLLNPGRGWYSLRNEKGDTSKQISSTHVFETYLQFQRQAAKGFLASDKFIRMFSVELRSRVQYGYPTYPGKNETSDDWQRYTYSEKYMLCINGYAGWKFNFSNALSPRLGAYLKGYYGINPYGQFRNINNYQFLGLSLVYEN